MRAAGYVRVSTGRQATEGWSLGEQEARVRAYVEAKGWDLVEVFVEAGVSGRRDDRPELGRLLARLDELDAVLVPKLDRLGRTTSHLFEVLGRLERAGVVFVSVGESIDTSSAHGRLTRTLLAGVAEFESDRMSERIRDGVAARMREGRWHGGAPPYGYRAVDGELVVDFEQARVVARVFERFLEGATQSQIARELTRRGVPAARGGGWEQRRIGKLLGNPVYAGRLRLGQQVIEGRQEAVVSVEMFEQAQLLLGGSGAARGRGRGRPTVGSHLFRGGLLRCGCGAPMTPRRRHRPGGRIAETYVCRQHLRDRSVCPRGPVDRALVDGAVYDYFEHVALDVDATRAVLVERIARDRGDALAELRRAERDRDGRLEWRERIERDYASGELSAANYDRLTAKIADELTALDAETARLADQVALLGERIDQAAEAADEALAPIAELRARIVAELRAPERAEGVRAALARLFESFTLVTIADAEPGRIEADLELRADPVNGEPLVWLEPRPRPDAIAAVAALPWEDGPRPVSAVDFKLRRVPLPGGGLDDSQDEPRVEV